MALIDTLANVKKMKRSTRLRDEGLSDEEVMGIMEEIIQNSLIAQASGNKKMMKRSVDEMRQVRKDVRTGNVKLNTARQKTMIGRFSNLVDQMEGEETEVKQQASGTSGILSSLPSAETIISAVMTANPLLGYSTKILKDIGGSVKQKSQSDREAAKRQFQLLEQQKDYVLDRQEELALESDINESQASQIDSYTQILENIENEIVRLRKIWDGDDNHLVKESETTNNKLSQLVQAEETILEQQKLQKERDEIEQVEKEREGIDPVSGLMPDDDRKGKGILGNLVGMLGTGIMTGLLGVLGIFKAVGTVGLSLLKVGAKASVIGAVIMAIYDFIDGFFNAGDILEMDEADLNVKDRLIAGFGNVWGNIIKLFDTVLEWFDIDIIDSEDIEKRIAQGTKELVDNFFDWVFGLFDNVRSFIQDFDIGDTIETIKQGSIDFMNNLISIIPNMVTDAFSKVGDLFSSADEWLFGDDEEDAKRKENFKGELRSFRGMKNPAEMSFGGENASSKMKQSTDELNSSSNDGGNANVIAGNNNTNITNNKTEVMSLFNTSNLDDNLRYDRLRIFDRLKFS